MLSLSIPQQIAVWALPVLLSVTLHEAAHALVADKLGDKTARMLGRLSLNPFRHVDPFGTLIVPLLIGALTNFQFVFGWAKPVPINWGALRNPRRDIALVAAAGPLSNLFMALCWAGLLKILSIFEPTPNNITLFVLLTAQAGMAINIILAALNLLPLPPLDGGRILRSLLPPKHTLWLDSIEPYGMLILILLMVTGLLSSILMPIVNLSYNLIFSLLHL